MGSLPGYLVDGILLLTYGVWWLLLCLSLFWRKYNLKSRRTEDDSFKYKSYVSFFCPPAWPIESVLKMLLPVLGMFVGVFFTDNGNGHVKVQVWQMYNEQHQFNKLHHITIYCCFIVSGIADILSLIVYLFSQTHSTDILCACILCRICGVLFPHLNWWQLWITWCFSTHLSFIQHCCLCSVCITTNMAG